MDNGYLEVLPGNHHTHSLTHSQYGEEQDSDTGSKCSYESAVVHLVLAVVKLACPERASIDEWPGATIRTGQRGSEVEGQELTPIAQCLLAGDEALSKRVAK